MKKQIRMVLALLLALLLTAGTLSAFAAPAAQAALPDAAEEEHGMGLLPSERKIRFAEDVNPQRASLHSDVQLPTRYGFHKAEDGTLTVLNQTAPKNQRSSAACGFFRGTGAVEAWLLRNGAENGFPGVDANVDLSELHGLYATTIYGLTDKDYANRWYGSNLWTFDGIYDATWVACVMRGGPLGGMVYEADDPWFDLTQPAPCRDIRLTKKAGEKRFISVQGIRYLTSTADKWTDDADMRERYLAPVKKGVMDSGAVMTGMYMSKSKSYYNSATCAFYYPYNGSNHAVLIVGWDDEYPKENFAIVPKSDGAWLVKNSWGEDWGIGGYFWVSYCDLPTLKNAHCIEGAAPLDPDQVFYDAAPMMSGTPLASFTTTTQLTNPIAELYGIFPRDGTGVQLVDSIRIAFYSPAEFDLYLNTDAVPKKPEELDVSPEAGYAYAGRYRVEEPGFWTTSSVCTCSCGSCPTARCPTFRWTISRCRTLPPVRPAIRRPSPIRTKPMSAR